MSSLVIQTMRRSHYLQGAKSGYDLSMHPGFWVGQLRGQRWLKCWREACRYNQFSEGGILSLALRNVGFSGRFY
jgi:hypothetical protein